MFFLFSQVLMAMLFSVVNAYVFSVQVLHCYLLAWYKNTRLNLFFFLLAGSRQAGNRNKKLYQQRKQKQRVIKVFHNLAKQVF